MSQQIKIKIKTAKTFLENNIGLLSAKKPYPLLLKTRLGIHSFGMKFPIDVVILSKSFRVKALKENLKPNKVYFWDINYNLVLELPAKTIKEKKIKIGDKIITA
jgi:uncharacterized protein